MYSPAQQDIDTIKEIVNNTTDFSDEFLRKLLVHYNGDVNSTLESLLTGGYKDDMDTREDHETREDHGVREDHETREDHGTREDHETREEHVREREAPHVQDVTYTTVNMFDKTTPENSRVPTFIVPTNKYNLGINYFNIFLYVVMCVHRDVSVLADSIAGTSLSQDDSDGDEHKTLWHRNNFVKFVQMFGQCGRGKEDAVQFQDAKYYTVPAQFSGGGGGGLFDYSLSETFTVLIKSFIQDSRDVVQGIQESRGEDSRGEDSRDTQVSVEKMLVSSFSYYTDRENVNNLYCVHFPQEEYARNLTKMLNNLFIWDGEDDDGDGDGEDKGNKLISVGDFFTVIFDQDEECDDEEEKGGGEEEEEDDEEGEEEEVQIPARLYPGMYTAPSLHTIRKNIIPEYNSVKSEINDLNVKLNMKLKYHQGAPILSFLNTTLQHLTEETLESKNNEETLESQNNEETLETYRKSIETLNAIKEQLAAQKTQIIQEMNNLKEHLKNLNINNCELSPQLLQTLISNQKEDSPDTTSEYLLVGMIVSSNNYFILNSQDNNNTEKYSNFIIKNNTLSYNNTDIDSIMLKQLFTKFIKHSKIDPIMCIYCKRDKVSPLLS